MLLFSEWLLGNLRIPQNLKFWTTQIKTLSIEYIVNVQSTIWVLTFYYEETSQLFFSQCRFYNGLCRHENDN